SPRASSARGEHRTMTTTATRTSPTTKGSAYTLISADSHIVEPPDLWTERIDKKYRDKAPRIVRLPNGSDWWYSEDLLVTSPFSGTQPGLRFTDPGAVTINVEIKDLRPGAYRPDYTVQDMDVDGVQTSLI